jgi:imidazolonepropionase
MPNSFPWGIPTIETKSGYGLDESSGLKGFACVVLHAKQVSPHIAPTFVGDHIVPPEFRDNRASYLAMIMEQLIPNVSQNSRSRFHDVFWGDRGFTTDESRWIMQKTKQSGLAHRLHAEQFRAQSGAKLAAEMGVMTTGHLECVDAEDDGREVA